MTSTSPPHCHRSLPLLLLGCQPTWWPVPRPLDHPVCQEGSKPSLLLAFQAASRLVHRPPHRPLYRQVFGLLPVLARLPRCKTFFVSASVLTSASTFTSLRVSPLSHFLPCHPKGWRVCSPRHRPVCRQVSRPPLSEEGQAECRPVPRKSNAIVSVNISATASLSMAACASNIDSTYTLPSVLPRVTVSTCAPM